MIKVFTLENNKEWDSVVKTFKRYDVYYLSGYVKAFYIHGDGDPLLFFFENENVRGILSPGSKDVLE